MGTNTLKKGSSGPRSTGSTRPQPQKKERHRAEEIISRLEKAIPEADTALHYKNPFQLLIATLLSAQCTDVRVNQVTPLLFEAFPGPKDIIDGDPGLLISLIRSTGFFNNKSKNIIACSKKLIQDHQGNVPEDLDMLVALPGVGRKTANVVLSTAFGHQAIVVDTHVRRVSNRLGLVKSSDPVQIERDLSRLLPREKWTSGSHRLLLHGRHICKARKALCGACVLADICPSAT